MGGFIKKENLYVFGFSLILALLSLWVITEQDIFWQLRAGDEFFKQFIIQTKDTWSFTAYGEPWLNIQWLATAIMRAFFYIGADSFASMVVLRALLVFLIFSFLGMTLLNNLKNEKDFLRKNVIAVLIMGLSYIAIAFRLQIRSEIFVFLVLIVLFYIWSGDFADRVKQYSCFVAVILSANLHTGVTPFVVGASVVLLYGDRTLGLRKKMIFIGLCLIAIFITPHTYHSLPILYKHVFYFSNNSMPNPDHLPFSLSSSSFIFLVLCFLGCVGLLKSKRKIDDKILKSMFALFLIMMSFNRERTFPFAVLFLSPLSVVWIDKTKKIKNMFLFAAVPILFVLFGVHLKKFNIPWGFELSKTMYPIGSVDFIKKTKPAKNIYHGFAYGHYMDWNLQEYPVFTDTRETMFWKLQNKILASFVSPEITKELYKTYDINTVLNPIPATRYEQNTGFVDIIEQFNPSSEWAIVYFDHISVLVVRRIEENKSVYQNHEYVFLKPNLPHNNYVFSGNRNADNDLKYESEIAMCRKDEPENAFCKMAEVAWRRTKNKGSMQVLLEAKELLEGIDRRFVRRGDFLNYLVELMQTYKALGLEEYAGKIEKEINGMFGRS